MPRPDAALIEETTRKLQEIEFGGERAEELAIELERLNAVVLAEARTLSFELEPAHFAALLEARAR